MGKKQSNPGPSTTRGGEVMNGAELLKHLELLGFESDEKVTGFKGVVTSISFDLYGCVQAVLQPLVDKDGEVKEGRWYDVGRIKITGTERVMPIPDFPPAKGPAFKPIPN